MGRPRSINAEFFYHNKNYRDDSRIKAIRRKYGHEGYAICNMMTEALVEADLIQVELSDIKYEILAGDFVIDVQVLKGILEYAIKLDFFQFEDGFLRSRDLDKSLEGMWERRVESVNDLRRAFMSSRINKGHQVEFPEVSAAEMPQSKEKKSTKYQRKKKNNRSHETREEKNNSIVARRDFHSLLKKYSNHQKEDHEVDIHEQGDLDHLYEQYGYSDIDKAIEAMIAKNNHSIDFLRHFLQSKPSLDQSQHDLTTLHVNHNERATA